MQRCLFCKSEINSQFSRIKDGGKVCFCKSCVQKLINEGHIQIQVDRTSSPDGIFYEITFSYSLL